MHTRVSWEGKDERGRQILFFWARNTIKVDLLAKHVSSSISLSIFSYSFNSSQGLGLA